MTSFKSAKKSIITPKIKALWVDSRLDTKWDAEGTWGAKGKLAAKTAASVINHVIELKTSSFDPKKARNARSPIEEQADGTFLFTCKSKKKPTIYDSTGKEINKDIKIGNGSIVKYAVTLATYSNGPNCGVTAYLNGIQIIKLVEFSANPFQKEEGGFVYGEDSNPFALSNDDDDDASDALPQ